MEHEFSKVNILLSTFEPGNFLSEQLISLSNQTFAYQLYLRDDASFSAPKVSEIDQSKIKYLDFGQTNIGPKNSFFELLQNESGSDFVAFCDQDDVWKPEKLQVASEWQL